MLKGIAEMANPFMTSSWSVRFELPRDEAKGRKWSESLSATVICDTAERAADIVREAHADAVVWSINHKGKAVTYADPMTLAAITVARADARCPQNRRGYQKHMPNDFGRCAYCAAVIEPPLQPSSDPQGDPK